MRFFQFFPPVFFSLFFLAVENLPAQDLASWVVRFDIDSKEKVAAICSQARENHFDRLLVQVRGRADAYYQSDLVPKAENVEDDFDPLAEVLDRCKNVEVDAWLNVFYLWTGDVPPVDDHHPVLKRSWLLKDMTGRRVDSYSALEQSQRWIEGIYADPASEDYRLYFTAVVVELARKYPVQGIHLDFVRYPGSFFGAGGSLADDFEKEYGLSVSDLPEKLKRQDFAAWLNGSLATDQKRLFTARLIWDYQRAAEVTKLVAMVREALLEIRPGIRLSASVFPDPLEAFLDKGQDWPLWLSSGIVDEIFVMNYFGDKTRVGALYDQVVQVVGTTEKIWLGLGSYIKSAAEIAEEMARCSTGKQAACFFSLGHFLSQRKAVQAYVDAVSTDRKVGQGEKKEIPESFLVAGLQEVKECLAGHATPTCSGENDLVSLVDGEKTGGETEWHHPRTWLDLRGVFRYVNPYDGLAKVEEQLELASQSYELLVDGQPFDQVAQQYSQAGSRHHGGLLPRRYLSNDSRVDKLLAELEPGQVSPVIPVHNGFWVYQVLGKGIL